MPGNNYSPSQNYSIAITGNQKLYDADNMIKANMEHFDNAYGVEHYSPGQDPDASEDDFGRHDFLTLKHQASAPSMNNAANRCALYAHNNGIYLKNGNNGTATLVFSFNGNNIYGQDIPSGEIILFEKDTAVTGYNLQTNLDDHLVYIGSGNNAGGLPGAANRTGGTWTQPNHNHTGTTGTGSGLGNQTSYPAAGAYYVSQNNHTHTFTSNNSATANTWRPPGRVVTRQMRL